MCAVGCVYCFVQEYHTTCCCVVACSACGLLGNGAPVTCGEVNHAAQGASGVASFCAISPIIACFTSAGYICACLRCSWMKVFHREFLPAPIPRSRGNRRERAANESWSPPPIPGEVSSAPGFPGEDAFDAATYLSDCAARRGRDDRDVQRDCPFLLQVRVLCCTLVDYCCTSVN